MTQWDEVDNYEANAGMDWDAMGFCSLERSAGEVLIKTQSVVNLVENTLQFLVFVCFDFIYTSLFNIKILDLMVIGHGCESKEVVC